jgi:hypothetical protein
MRQGIVVVVSEGGGMKRHKFWGEGSSQLEVKQNVSRTSRDIPATSSSAKARTRYSIIQRAEENHHSAASLAIYY